MIGRRPSRQRTTGTPHANTRPGGNKGQIASHNLVIVPDGERVGVAGNVFVVTVRRKQCGDEERGAGG